MKILLFGGGLGNQIFEYVFYLYLKKKYPKEKIYGIYHKKWLKDHNGLEIDKIFDIDLPSSSYYATFVTYILYIIKKINPKTSLCSLNPYEPKLNAIFFNAYKPDKRYYEGLNNWISFRKVELKGCNSDVLKSIQNTQSVSIHVRRGDYLNSGLSTVYGGICTVQYYEKAIDEIKKILPNPQFYIFSDDMDWVRKNLCLENAVYIDWNKGENSYLDMYLMSFCKASIIANSTFSYWGAYLNKDVQVVVYPRKWFNIKDTPDIFRDEWIALD